MFLVLTSFIKGFDYSLNKSLLIFLLSFLSNTFSAISGGGAGLIQLPTLILSGIPYYQALATHKLATVALGVGGSIRNYKTLSNEMSIFWKIIFGVPGVILGASIVEIISEEFLYFVLGIFSILLAFYSINKSNFGLSSEEKQITLISQLRFAILIFIIGILNGSISSGTGLLVTLLLIKNYGMDFLRAISMTFFSVGIFWNALGAIFLGRIGSVPYNLLVLLIIGSFAGGFFGAHLSKLKGNKIVKKTFTLVSLLVGSSLLIKSITQLSK